MDALMASFFIAKMERSSSHSKRSIEAGDKLSGISIMKMSEGLDKGDVIYQEPVKIEENDSATVLQDKFIIIGIESLLTTLDSMLENNYMLHPQDDNLATYAKKIKKDEAKIDWNTSAEKIHKKIMAFNAWPVAETSLSGERIRIHDSEFRELKVNGFPGNIKSVSKKFIEVFTKMDYFL